jgi:hypothetical protein
MSTASEGNEEGSSVYHLYQYVPSLGAAIAAIVIFAILTIAHFYRLIRQRAWFCIAFAVGGLCKHFLYIVVVRRS